MTEEQKTQAILMRCRGATYQKIAAAIGCNESTVRRRLNRHVAEKRRAWDKDNRERVNACKRALYAKNAEKVNARNKAWQAKNIEKVKTYKRAWSKNNAEKVNARNKAWRAKNPEKAREIQRNYRQTPNGKIRDLLRARLNIAIKNKQKTGSAVRDLGCTIPELRAHLEAQFTDGMTWGNHSKEGWHIDHIKPLASFDLEDRQQLKEACHYTNLQPLWWVDNLSKGAKCLT